MFYVMFERRWINQSFVDRTYKATKLARLLATFMKSGKIRLKCHFQTYQFDPKMTLQSNFKKNAKSS